MPFWSDLISSLLRRRPTPPSRKPAPPPPARSPRTGPPAADAELSPGRDGATATLEIDPQRVGEVRTAYAPNRDAAPDPGEIVWTWVPFEENDGRGKDRPVLVVAAEPAGTYLVVQLTSKNHTGEGDFMPVGSGDWDGEHRPSWVNLDRVLRVHTEGMRREAAALPKDRFDAVAARLRARYHWR